VLFEYLVLSGFQAGLNWKIIMGKMDAFRAAFANYDIAVVAAMSPESDLEKLMQNAGIIRNKQKILAAFANAAVIKKIQLEFGSFSKYLWSFVNHKPVFVAFPGEVPTRSTEADTASADLQKRGGKFVGPTIMCAFMLSMGLIHGHRPHCFVRQHVEKSFQAK
jgi:DNA-3-methyladenine glycosylase I